MVDNENNEQNNTLPSTITSQDLDKSGEGIAQEILKETDYDKSKQLLDLFNVNIAKKNVLRMLKLSKLLDKVDDETVRRMVERPDSITTKELMDLMTLLQNSIDKIHQSVEDAKDTQTTIQWNQQNNSTININVNKDGEQGLNRDSRAKVVDFIQKILNDAKNQSDNQEVIDVTPQNNNEGNEN